MARFYITLALLMAAFIGTIWLMLGGAGTRKSED